MYRDHSVELMPIMSAWARSLQRPPRSRASPSRTSFQSSSVSRMTPSRSNTTASTCAVVAPLPVDEPPPGAAGLPAHDLADEDRVVAGGVLGRDPALEPGERALDEGAEIAVADVDAGPQRDRRDAAAAEVLRHRFLIAAEEARGEATRTPDRL